MVVLFVGFVSVEREGLGKADPYIYILYIMYICIILYNPFRFLSAL